MLVRRQLILPLALATPAGSTARMWDYKQKKNLVILFLHATCAACNTYLAHLGAFSREFADREAVVLGVYPELLLEALAGASSDSFVIGNDRSGDAARAYLGEAQREKFSAFVADRYGELKPQWLVESEDRLPAGAEVLGWLAQIEVDCEECGAPRWTLPD